MSVNPDNGVYATAAITKQHTALDLIHWAEWVLRANGWHKTGPETGAAELHKQLRDVLDLNDIKPK